MIGGAVQLLAQRGLQGASFNEVLTLTGASRGSIYHHFPGGKDELVAAALDTVAARTMSRLEAYGGSVVELTGGFLGLWSDLLDVGRLTAGCAVVAVTVAADGELLDRAGDVFGRWTDQLARLFERAGLPPVAAAEFAAVLISSTEGAVIMSRARRTRDPFDTVARFLVAEAQRRTDAAATTDRQRQDPTE